MVVAVSAGVVNVVPVPNRVPAVRESCQFIVPAEATALSVMLPESQRDSGAVEVIVGGVFMVAVIGVLVGVVHPDKEASI